jgi:hypothetical protein
MPPILPTHAPRSTDTDIGALQLTPANDASPTWLRQA